MTATILSFTIHTSTLFRTDMSTERKKNKKEKTILLMIVLIVDFNLFILKKSLNIGFWGFGYAVQNLFFRV